MKKITLIAIVLTIALASSAQRRMENLDRGVVAVKVNTGVFVSWRTFATEWYNVTYNIYRDGTKLNAEPLSVSNYTDAAGTDAAQYTVRAVINGEEQTDSKAVTPWSRQYKSIKLKYRNPSLYRINDCTTADLDGDGEYELIVKRVNTDWSVANDSAFGVFEAYKLDGTFMWEINVGPNMVTDVEQNIAAFDFDGDNKAEVYLRTTEGTVLPDGTVVKSKAGTVTNYRSLMSQSANLSYQCDGDEFLTLLDGETGKLLDHIEFIPRGSSVNDWGDGYGHRANKFFFGAPYLDGLKPSLFIGRGIYTQTKMRTYDVVDKKLVLRWSWESGNSGDWYGQGYHNYTIADVDMDGRDEIVWGSMTIDDNGKGLYTTALGHGDAMHVGDLDPYRKGIEVWRCLENSPQWGTVFQDGATGKLLIHDLSTGDCGRSCAANVSNKSKGAELWGSVNAFSATTLKMISPTIKSMPYNYRIYWDGDLLEECVDHYDFTTDRGTGYGSVYKYNEANQGASIILQSIGYSCNYTKGTPCLQADLFGDWREEVIWHSTDEQSLLVYTTINPTSYRNYTLMHDHQYRQAINWQMCGYNQPPHTSYFLGELEGKILPPPPVITNERLQYQGGGVWDKTSTSTWKKDGEAVAFSDGDKVLFDATNGQEGTVTEVKLAETVAPELLAVNSTGNYKLDASEGKLTGNMIFTKMGKGSFGLTGTHDYTGATEVWGGRLNIDGNITNSKILLEFFGELDAEGSISDIEMRYGSQLYVGGDSLTGKLTANNLTMKEGAEIVCDLYAPDSPLNDSLIVNGDFSYDNNIVFRIIPHLAAGVQKLAGGEYTLAMLNRDVKPLTTGATKIKVEGILGTAASVEIKSNPQRIVLVVTATRDEASVIWKGDVNDVWDMSVTKNFVNNNISDIFVDRDMVTFNDDAVSKTVDVSEQLTPSSVVVDAVSDYTFQGEGSIVGKSSLSKAGTSTLSINTVNSFSGKISVTGGTVKVPTVVSTITDGALGEVSSNAEDFVINNAKLHITDACFVDKAMTVGSDSATLCNDNRVIWRYLITGGVLTKTGSGDLLLAAPNKLSRLVVKEGRLTLYDEDAIPAGTVVLAGGTLQDYNNVNTYSSLNYGVEVPSGKSGTWNLDSRCTYTGVLTGSGAIAVNIPNVRSDLAGDWSNFEGDIAFYDTYNNSKYKAELRLNNSKGLGKATVNIATPLYIGNSSQTTITFGALCGSGALDGSKSYNIGGKNVDCTYSGVINGTSSITKSGTAVFTLSGANTYSGATTVTAGTLAVSNTTGSATGTGNVTVKQQATFTGSGSISGSLTAESGATIVPGVNVNSDATLTVGGALYLKKGSILSVGTRPLFSRISNVAVTGNITIDETSLVITNVQNGGYKAGQVYKLFTCSGTISGSFSSVTPEIPAEGLAWDFSYLNTLGEVRIVESVSSPQSTLSAVSIYPNPSHNNLFVNLGGVDDDNITITVTDIAGRENMKKIVDNKKQTINLNVSSLNQGVYFIRIESEDGMVSRKFVKK